MELGTEIEKHKKTTRELESCLNRNLHLSLVKHEVSVLIEEKIKLCEKIGSLSESCNLKDHSNESSLRFLNSRLLKKDMEKRMAEMRVLEKRLEVGYVIWNDV